MSKQAKSALRQRQTLCASMLDSLASAGSVQGCWPEEVYKCTTHQPRIGLLTNSLPFVLWIWVRVTLLHFLHTWTSGTSRSSRNPKHMACCHSLHMPHLIISPSSWTDHRTFHISNQHSNTLSHLIAITGASDGRVIFCITVARYDSWVNWTCAFIHS